MTKENKQRAMIICLIILFIAGIAFSFVNKEFEANAKTGIIGFCLGMIALMIHTFYNVK